MSDEEQVKGPFRKTDFRKGFIVSFTTMISKNALQFNRNQDLVIASKSALQVTAPPPTTEKKTK